MEKTRLKKTKPFKSVALMLLFYICSSESLIVGTNSAPFAWSIYISIHYVIFVVLSVRYLYLKKGIIRVDHPLLLAIIAIIVNFVFAEGSNALSTYLHIITVITNGWLISEQFSLDSYLDSFETATFLIAGYSLVVYVLALIAPDLIRSFPVIVNLLGNKYYCTGLAILSQKGLDSGTLYRSFGVFREPGVFQVFLNLSFCIYLFKFRGTQVWKIALYVMALLSTVSSTGIIAMLFIFIIYAMKSNSTKKIPIILVLISFVAVLYGLTIRYEIFFNALTKVNNNNDISTIARVYSIFANLQIWQMYPIIGSGMSMNSTLFPSLIASQTRKIVGDNTNSYLFLLSCFGIIPFCVYIRGLYSFAKDMLEKGASLLMLVFLAVLAGENLLYSSFIWVFVFYGNSMRRYKALVHFRQW